MYNINCFTTEYDKSCVCVGTGSNYKPPVRDRPSSSDTQSSGGGYGTSYGSPSSVGGSAYSGYNQNSGSSGYSHSQPSGSPSSGTGYSHGQNSGGSSLGLSNNNGNSYSHTANSGESLGNSGSSQYSGGSYNSNVNKPSRSPSPEPYDSHETYHANHRPSGSSSGSMGFSNSSRPSSGHQSPQDNYRPLVTDYNTPSRPSISININKDVTYNVDRPDALSNGEGTNMYVPDRPIREPIYTNNNHQKTTEKYNDPNNDYNPKPTTKKPVVINSININIHSSDLDNPSGNLPTSPKTTTRRPTVNNNNKNTKATTRRPTTTPGYQSNRPSRNPEIISDTQYQRPGSGYNQGNYEDNERTTERNYHSYNNQGSKEQTNQRPPGVDFIENSRPNPIPSSRPSGGSGNKKIPRPLNNSG